MLTDFFGIEIKLGDTVAFMQIKYRNLLSGTVVKLAPKSVLISHSPTNWGSTETRQEAKQVIVKRN